MFSVILGVPISIFRMNSNHAATNESKELGERSAI